MSELKTKPRGFTLLEMMVSSGLVAILMAAAATVIIVGARTAYQQDMMADARAASSVVERTLSSAFRNAGFGAPGGLRVMVGSGSIFMNPFYVSNNTGAFLASSGTTNTWTTGTDELYVVTPDVNASVDDCSTGSASSTIASVATSGVGYTITLACTTSIKSGDNVVVFEPTVGTGALLTQITVAGNVITNYAEKTISGFTPNGISILQKGQVVYRAKLQHFYIASNPQTSTTGQPRSALFLEDVLPGTAGTAAAPLKPLGTPNPRVVQDGVEDVQFLSWYDTNKNGNPGEYSNVYGVTPDLKSTQPLRAVTYDVSTVTRMFRMNDNTPVKETGPASIGDHTVTTPSNDGKKRVVARVRVDIPNTAIYNTTTTQNPMF